LPTTRPNSGTAPQLTDGRAMAVVGSNLSQSPPIAWQGGGAWHGS
jgi:hypothetical protein